MEKSYLEKMSFSQKTGDAFSSVFVNPDLKMALVLAEEEYIPIENFRNTFEKVSSLVTEFTINALVFDKRALRTFHQPSMEWYFAAWKPEMRRLGMTQHYKILPDIDWFRKAVEAGKQEILQKYGRDFISGINIKYVASIEESVLDFKSQIHVN